MKIQLRTSFRTHLSDPSTPDPGKDTLGNLNHAFSSNPPYSKRQLQGYPGKINWCLEARSPGKVLVFEGCFPSTRGALQGQDAARLSTSTAALSLPDRQEQYSTMELLEPLGTADLALNAVVH